jgi:hypothetical protein
MKTGRLMVPCLLACTVLHSANAEQHRLIGNRFFKAGDICEYALQLQADIAGIGQVDCTGTVTWHATGTENVAGYDTIDVNQLYAATSCSPATDGFSYAMNFNQFFTSDHLAEACRQTEDELLTVINDDPWELLPTWVDESDDEREFGYGQYEVYRRRPPYGKWTGYFRSYITFLRHQQIAVPAGTFECTVVLVKLRRHDSVGSGGYVDQTMWLDPSGLPVKIHAYQWIWDSPNQEQTEATTTMELTSTNIGPSIAADVNNVDFGGRLEQQTFEVRNSGLGAIDYSLHVSEGVDYFSVSPTTGSSTGPADAKTHTVTVNRSNIALGQTVSGKIVIQSPQADNSPQEISLSAHSAIADHVFNIAINHRLDYFNPPFVRADFDRDGSVDFADFASLAGQWLGMPLEPSADIAPTAPDGTVDQLDLAAFAGNWLRKPELAYVFCLELASDQTVEMVEFTTPAGRSFEIPKEPYTYIGQVETCYGRENGTHNWEYEGRFDDVNSLASYGDGLYTVTVRYESGAEAQTEAWFGVPDTNAFIPQPAQEPLLVHPAESELVDCSPVAFAWEPCTDPNVTSIVFEFGIKDVYRQSQLVLPPEANALSPVLLRPETWEASLSFDHSYDYNNPDDVHVEVGKYSKAGCTFEVSPIILRRDFDDANASDWTVVDEGTINAPSSWSAAGGSMVQSSNIYAGNGVSVDMPGTYARLEHGACWTDYRLTLNMKSDDDDAIGVMFRYRDNNNYYRFSWDRQRSYRRLVRKQDGVFAVLAEDAVPYVTGRTYQIQIAACGATLEVLIDDQLIFSVNDPAIESGTIAFYSWGNMGSSFDDILVEYVSPFDVAEDFDDGDSSDWTVVDEGTFYTPSDWSASTGRMVQNSNIFGGDGLSVDMPGTYARFEPGLCWTDYRVTLNIRSDDDDAIGFMFRCPDNNNYYRFSWDAQRACRRLVKKKDGLFTVLAEDAVPYVAGRTYKLEILASGSVLEVFIDDALIFHVTDFSLASGTIALYSWGNMGSHFDDIVVKGL